MNECAGLLDLNLWVLLNELLVITVLCIFCLCAAKVCILNDWICSTLVISCCESLCIELDLDLFCSGYVTLCWCYEKNIIVDLVHMDAIRYIFNPMQRQGNLNRMQPCLPYPSFLRVRKPGSSTHPYYFGWDCDLRKRVTAERASSIGVCWQTLHTELGSGPLKPIEMNRET